VDPAKLELSTSSVPMRAFCGALNELARIVGG
jgi:hypothetical protein